MRINGGALALVLAGMLVPHVASALPRLGEPPRVTASSAFLMDAQTGEVLWERSPDLQLPPASTTKVMTAILALESGRSHDLVTASDEACSAPPSKINLQPGQRLALEDLVYAILLNSANDASVAIAEHLADSVSAFGVRMTARARQLGALNTRFVNPNGLTAEGHYSTTRDLATIFRYALGVPRFRDIISTKAVVVDVANSPRRIALHSHNRLLDSERIPVIGKTGYTIPAKKCFVGEGTYGGREIIVAVLGSRDLWGDTRRLLAFGFGDAPPAQRAPQWARSSAAAPTTSDRRRGSGPEASGGRHRARTKGARRTVAKSTATYAVHVGTFERAERARRLQQTLGQRGYDVAIDCVPSGTGKRKRIQYRVQVGPYTNRGQAESAARSMASDVEIDARIVRR